ncbi:MAG: AsmA family protein [Nitrospirae bacterium]|nr:AsmA family protein [Nitrospirota bacterium]
MAGQYGIPLMNAKKKVLLIFGAAAAALVLAAVIFALTFDINSYRSRIEAAASGATGLEVRIDGKMGLSFFPFGVSAKDIHIANKGGEILSLEILKLGAELMPLLKKQLKVTRCELVKPALTIVKNADGKYNFESTEKKSTKGQPGAAFSLNELKLFKGVLAYLDKKTGEKTEFKDFNLAIKDLTIEDTAADIMKNVSFTGSFDCAEVLQKDFRIENLKAPVKAVKGIYNFEPLTIGALLFFDKKAGEKTELKEISLAIKDLSVVDTSGVIIKNISFTGTMDCKEVRKKDLKIDNVKSPVKVVRGVIYLIPLTMDIFGAKGEGDATADKSEVDAVYRINLKVLKLDFAKLQESFGTKKVIGGKGDLYASLTIKEEGSRNLMRGMDGTFSLRGDNLVMYTMDLDKVLSSYETSQEFNLVDLGAFFIAGPLGTAAIKGYRYGDVYSQTRGGRGTITQFISHWKIKDGVADAADCALATRHNRVALKGKLNLVSGRYDNVIVALLDEKGCAKFKQGISGPFGSPQIGAVSAVESLGGPISSLYRKAKRFVRGGKCEVFYSGAVHQPSK